MTETTPKYDILGIGNAIVDVVARAEDTFLSRHDMHKGAMILIDSAMAEAYEVNVAPHNYYGHLCSAVSAHFCAVVPNFRVMEIDIDSVAWRDELFINAPIVENGELIVPDRPGWGVDVNEAAVRAHPPKG
ncbi:MAG: hypothetical protein QOD93_5930 [Acetobacteraceae bacterium]|nr:hypothetical protein [Acetobacteraceae bacterium]